MGIQTGGDNSHHENRTHRIKSLFIMGKKIISGNVIVAEKANLENMS